MKNKGLFEIRDNLIIRLLRGTENDSASPEESEKSLSSVPPTSSSPSQFHSIRADFIYTFSFESIADHKAFRETNQGLLYLLHFFHEAHSDLKLQSAIYDILKSVMGPIEDNKKIITSLLEDQEVLDVFFFKIDFIFR